MTLNDLWIVTLAEQQMQYFTLCGHCTTKCSQIISMLYISLHVHLSCFTLSAQKAVCSGQLSHRAGSGCAGVTGAQVTTLAFKNQQSRAFRSSLMWSPCSGWKLLCPGDNCGFSAQSVMSAILPHLNTDTDTAVCLLSFFLCFTDHTRVSFRERKLMTTRHELGKLVLEIVPQ